MIVTKINIIVLTLLLYFQAGLVGQSAYKNTNPGYPFIKYFSPQEYKLGVSNWCILQDKRGVMYFGNEKGILEYDGSAWRIIETPYKSTVRSLAMDRSGRIFVCASSDFGYLHPDSIGQLKFKSLLSYLNQNERDYGEMWDVVTSSEGAFFKSWDKIFRWNGKDIKVWDSVYAFRLYKLEDKVYSRNQGTGLMMIEKDSIKLMPDGEFFSDMGVFDMLPFRESNNTKPEILITTNYDGLFLSAGEKFYPFKTNADEFLKNNQVYNTCITEDGNFAFATQRGGVGIINHKGDLLNVIDENSGLPTNVIYDVYPDRQKALWLATNNGIVYCEVPSPISILPKSGLLKSPLFSMLRYNKKLYTANDLGISYLDYESSSLKLIKGFNKPAFQLLNYNGILIAGTNWGIEVIENDKSEKLLLKSSTNFILPSRFYPGRIYAALRDGLTVLQQQKNKNDFDIYETTFDEEILIAVEDNDSSLWLQSLDGDIIHIKNDLNRFSTGVKNRLQTEYYRKETLPGYALNLYNLDSRMVLATDKGLFRFNKALNTFIPDSTFDSVFTDPTNIISNMIKCEHNNDLWILANIKDTYELGKAVLQRTGKYHWEPEPFLRRLNLNSITSMYAESDPVTMEEILWLYTDEGLIRYIVPSGKGINSKYLTLIRKVEVDNDSIIYGGAKPDNAGDYTAVLPFTSSNISFEVSAISFDKPEAALYQYYLEGNDDGWSQWTPEAKKEYTNLSSGEYRFHVRAKNVYGIAGNEDTFSFTMLPPWYLTWWAYAAYLLMIIIGIYLTDRIMRRRVIRREQEKAKIREAELTRKQAEELETVDRLVRVINHAEDLESLFNSLLKQTMNFIPNAEKAAVFLLNKKDNLFRVAYTAGYKVQDLEKISFTPEELKKRYAENSHEAEKGIYILKQTNNLYGDEKLSGFSKADSMLVMAVEKDDVIEAYVVFDCFTASNPFDYPSARLLDRFREHAVSAISKAQAIKTLQEKNEEITRTQEQLVTQQKLASLGALTAGIAHEIKNPLNFVNNFSEISRELLDEMKTELQNGNKEEAVSIIDDLKLNLEKINHHGKRADSIVKGMLLHSRGSSGEKTLTDLNGLLDQYAALAYHGLKAQDKEFNISIEKDYDESIGKINIVPQDISRVFLNIINNACYAVNEKKSKNRIDFAPTVYVSTKNCDDKVKICIKDNGGGIPENARKNLFNPFFTTKPAGEGTGLGLSISYDIIVKQHAGEIKFESEEGKYTEFIITIPKNEK